VGSPLHQLENFMTAFIAYPSSVHAVAGRDIETEEPVGIQELT